MSAGADGKLAWIDAYLAHLRGERQLAANTTSAYARDLQELAALSDGHDWPQIDHHAVRRYAAKLHARELDPRSIARKLSSWRGFYDWLGSRVALAANPVQGVRAPKRARSLPRALSVDDAVRLVAPPPHRAGDDGVAGAGADGVAGAGAGAEPAELCSRAMFELLYSSGLRVSELAGLDLAPRKDSLGWVEFVNREVIVTGKGGKRRIVPVGAAAMAALAAWIAVRPAPADGGDALFVSARGTRVSPRVIQQRLAAHGVAAGAPVHVHPHMLRHSFASHVLQSSGDLRAVQDMLGHSSISSTQVYTALDFQHLAEVYDKAHPRAKVK
jgi:integrase/recombinase XerC